MPENVFIAINGEALHSKIENFTLDERWRAKAAAISTSINFALYSRWNCWERLCLFANIQA